jgi:hypothetical protein
MNARHTYITKPLLLQSKKFSSRMKRADDIRPYIFAVSITRASLTSDLPRGYVPMVLHAKQDKMNTAADE